jgi:hypothetical protein
MKRFCLPTIGGILVFLAVASIPSRSVAQSPPSATSVNLEAGCLSGYPDSSYYGDRSITRYEFAARLDACLQKVEQFFNKRDYATKTDLAPLIQRQQELNQELRQLHNRVDTLDPNEF